MPTASVPSEPLDLEAIEAEHAREDEPVSQFNPHLFWCKECDHRWPCPTLALCRRVRELEEALNAALGHVVSGWPRSAETEEILRRALAQPGQEAKRG